MIPKAILPLIRRAIVDLLNDIGGEHNDEVLAALLAELGHRISRRDVAEQLEWLASEAKVIKLDDLGLYKVARIVADGRDIAEGRLVLEGISRFKTGD